MIFFTGLKRRERKGGKQSPSPYGYSLLTKMESYNTYKTDKRTVENRPFIFAVCYNIY